LHLSPERLAALTDEAPSAAELVHLSACADCARERRAFQQLSSMASSESARIGVPITTWESLAPALVADRVIDRGGRFVFSRGRVGRQWLQAAAAVLLVTGGMIAGRVTANTPPASMTSDSTTSAASATALASADSGLSFQTIDDARAAQERSQAVYQNATAFLAQHDSAAVGANTPSAMRTRLAALDRVRETMGEALNKAPYDPVINDYLFAAIGQREATLRQLNTALPAGMRLTSY
jgi:hypothetical protein